jgi:uncharacterized phage protein gp47/JayE
MTSNYVDATGIHTQTREEITSQITTGMQGIYGSDINVAANSPDGQLINIFAQAKLDMLETITQVYNSFSPDYATGAVLDQRVAINGLVRLAATYTRVPVVVNADRVVSLAGLDTSTSPFTVTDISGNKYYLETTTSTTITSTASVWAIGTTYAADAVVLHSDVYYKSLVGSNIGNTPSSSPTQWLDLSMTFRAAADGAVLTTTNTITVISTTTLGVLSVSNPSANIQDGVDEETDAALRIRRRASVSVQSEGFLAGLTGALTSLDGVTGAVVFENNTNVTDSNGIPGHSLWAIVDGGTDADIANAIYVKRNAGCGIYGSEYVDVEQVNGTLLRVYFDRPETNKLYVKMVLASIDPNHTPDTTYIAAQILAQVSYGIQESADFTAITSLVKSLDPLAVVTSGGVAGPYPYKAATTYEVDDMVAYGSGNATYRCILQSTGNLPTNGTYWEVHSLVSDDYEMFLPTATVQGKWILDASRIQVT